MRCYKLIRLLKWDTETNKISAVIGALENKFYIFIIMNKRMLMIRLYFKLLFWQLKNAAYYLASSLRGRSF